MTNTTPRYETLVFDLHGWRFAVRYAWDIGRGRTYFHMTASNAGIESLKVCGPVEVGESIAEDSMQHAKSWLASRAAMGREKVSSHRLSTILSDELSAVVGARVMPPMIERRADSSPNWTVQMPREREFREAVERVMACYDLE